MSQKWHRIFCSSTIYISYLLVWIIKLCKRDETVLEISPRWKWVEGSMIFKHSNIQTNCFLMHMRKVDLALDHTAADLFCAPKHKLIHPPSFSGSNGTNGYNFIEMDLNWNCNENVFRARKITTSIKPWAIWCGLAPIVEKHTDEIIHVLSY